MNYTNFVKLLMKAKKYCLFRVYSLKKLQIKIFCVSSLPDLFKNFLKPTNLVRSIHITLHTRVLVALLLCITDILKFV